MAFSPHAVANWFLARKPIDQMKLHKLVYFAHGWRLGLFEKPLIDEEIEAWRYGPVVRSLYHEFKEFGARPITDLATTVEIDGTNIRFRKPKLPDDNKTVQALMERVWEQYGKKSGTQLSAITHLPDSPWTKIRERYGDVKGAGIPNDLIQEYFKKLAAQA